MEFNSIISVPPNVQFELDDIEGEWTYSQPFDYIHARYLAGSINDWPTVAEQAFEYVNLHHNGNRQLFIHFRS